MGTGCKDNSRDCVYCVQSLEFVTEMSVAEMKIENRGIFFFLNGPLV